jgi:glycerol dehydrogenase
MKKVIIMPRKYVQGFGVIAEVNSYISLLGCKPALIWDKIVRNIVSEPIIASLKKDHMEPFEIMFNGECTKEEANRISAMVIKTKNDVIVGIGGGKTLDTARAVAAYNNLPLVIIPTTASSNAPISSYTVWYNEKGEHAGYDGWKFNPDIVLVDTAVLVKAPVRFFLSGIGDALASWHEANASYISRTMTFSGGVHSMTIMNMAKLCFDTLLQYGKMAKLAVINKVVTPAFEKVIEASILLSGLCWESGGVSSAHAIALTLHTVFPETHKFLHGECVAFGLVCQLCLEEDLSADEVNQVIDFMIDMELPVSFDDFNLHDLHVERIKELAKVTISDQASVHSHNFKVTIESLTDAIIFANSLGNSRKSIKSEP